ncbi:MAG: glycosyltransferase family 39 protein [Bacteroidia bacterium]|nr:glycosyltransferase family 39 protein [Bacteroidia bacterium]
MNLLTHLFSRYTCFFISIISLLILLPFTGNVHLFDWDEINFAECAREMIVTNSYHTPLINFQSFWEKPPLFIWMQVLSMKLLGINELAARLPNIINGIVTLCLLFYFGKKWYNPSFGILWAVIHLGTFLPHLYFRSGIIDPWYNFFGFVFYVSMIEFIRNNYNKWLYIGSVGLGLSVLTKGPAMVVLTGLSIIIAIWWNKQKLSGQQLKWLSIGLFIFLLTGSSWFLFELFSGHKEIIEAFIDYQIRLFKTQDSGHGGFLLYHFVVILIGCFPTSIIMLKYFFKSTPKDFYSKSMLVLMLVTLIIFSIVKTKIVHYSSFSYFSVSFLATYVLQHHIQLHKIQNIILRTIGLLIGLILILISTVEHWKHLVIPYIETNDVFAAENLKMNVKWYGYEFLSGILLIVSIVWYSKIKEYVYKHHVIFFSLMIIWINFTINNYFGKIEQYLQSSAIHFFEFCGDKSYKVDTYAYKSYAHLFYSRRTPPSLEEQAGIEKQLKNLENAGFERTFSYNLAYLNWLIYDDIKAPVFLVCKIQDEKEVLQTGKFRKLYSKGGYVFFMKQPIVQ